MALASKVGLPCRLAAEILLLRHQLAVLQRRQPRRLRLDWADRAFLATLLAAIPKARRHGLQLLVTPEVFGTHNPESSRVMCATGLSSYILFPRPGSPGAADMKIFLSQLTWRSLS